MPHTIPMAVALCSITRLALERWEAAGRDPAEAVVLVRALTRSVAANPAGEAEAQMRAAFEGCSLALGDAEDAVGRMRAHWPVMARSHEQA